MRLPRDLSGDEMVRLLRRHYGYQLIRQRGSHMRLATTIRGTEHRVSVPRHDQLKVGALRTILSLVATYLDIEPEQLQRELFG